jgi:TatD DNase family protein
MALIDFHCHLDLYPDPHAVALEAQRREAYVLSVTTTPSAFLGTCALVGANGKIRTALGLHPEIAVEREGELSLFETLLPCTQSVGEVGLDGSRPHRETLDRQGAILSNILDLCARIGGRTISLHSREATKLLLDVLEAEPRSGTPVLHWFNGTEKEIKRAAEMGCWFSVSTSMLSSERGRKSVQAMPPHRVLPESDGPFGFVDGRASYPWEAMLVAHELGPIWRLASPEAASTLTANFRSITELTNGRTAPQS